MMSFLTYITGFFMNFELSHLGTFWLKIEQFWHFIEISIFSNGGHLGYMTVLTDTILKGDHLRIILFNIYYGIFYELWTFTDFDRLCKLEKRVDEIKKKSSPRKLLSQYQPNFAEMILGWPPRYISAERKFSQKNQEYMLNYSLPCSCS
jgi:hypothetical protein